MKYINNKILIAVANAVILLTVVITSGLYVRKQGKLYEAQTQASFISTAVSMQKVAHGLLLDQQLGGNEWARFISERKMTMTEALVALNLGNVSPNTMTHIIDYDTLKGYAAVYKDGKFLEEDFSPIRKVLEPVIDELGVFDPVDTHITQHFTNPADGKSCVGFCQDVELTSSLGRKHYLIIRTVLVNYINSQLFFPDYNKAKLSLITSEGEFVIRSNATLDENFWDSLRKNNALSIEEQHQIKESIDSLHVQSLEFLDSDGEPSFYVCIPAADDDWQFIAYIQKSELSDTRLDLTIVFIVLIGIGLLIFLDGLVLIQTNKRLVQSVEETRRANLAKTSFLSSMSHDIRTPMNAIVGMSTIAMRNLDNKDHIRDCLRKITLASNHLLTLINDVLDISKIESGKLSLNPVVFSLAEAAENLMNIVRIQIREKGLIFEIHTSKITKEYLYADEVRLNQIFINLLTNAIKYTNDGGKVVLTLKEDEIPGDNENVMLTYSVSDNGIGMSPEFQRTMYDAFSRAVDTRVNKISGTGLGLAITKQMVDLMGGTIECESEVGKGTTFTVKLKLPLSESLTDSLVLPPMTVLIADDDPIFLETANDTFSSLGITADVAKNGEDALEMVCKKHASGTDYPVVIIDWKMPGMDGLETTRQIREKVGDHVPIIVVSSYDWTDIEAEARAAGVNAFINKPFFRSTVYYKMSELLNIETDIVPEFSDDYSDLKGMKILVAEDNELNWEITNELLTYYGVETFHAPDGKVCVDMIKNAAPDAYDAILMDVQMPIMNGKDAARTIRAMTNNPLAQKITIVAMTADAFTEDMEACLEAGMNGHISKPVDLKKLLKELRRSIGGGVHK